ncbi:alpha/beta hydrolase [Leucothrix sargassi]|nr:alpha/beta hydrolase [Leucothrix sargassi]
MKVTKDDLHESLKSLYFPLSIMTRLTRYKWYRALMNKTMSSTLKFKSLDNIHSHETHVPSSDGQYQIRVKVYRPAGVEADLPVMLYLHGGGYISGCPEVALGSIEKFINTRQCVVVAPDYRKAFEAPFPAGFNDCYDTLLWIRDQASSLGVLPDKLMIGGHSAGGGMTAALTLKARDTKDVKVAFQMPIYPMIDDTQVDDPERSMESLIWDDEMNKIAWTAYLSGLKAQGKDVPSYAAPARNKDYQDFPPTLSFVGDKEPFYQETVDYVEALKAADIPVTFKVFEGCFHAFDMFEHTEIGSEAQRYTMENYAKYYDKYIQFVAK